MHVLPVDGPASIFLAVGLATLAAAVLPRLLHRAPISMPVVFLGMGALGFWLLPQLPDPSPIEHPDIALHLTEVCVIVSLMGAGLAINRPFAWRTWGTTWRLLAITMPLSMIAVGVLGWAALGLGAASAILLAAALAPTDPVLATEVQVSEPVDEPGTQDDEARFALTSEAGLNDGLAFPFTYAAIAVSLVGGRTRRVAGPVGRARRRVAAQRRRRRRVPGGLAARSAVLLVASRSGCGSPSTPRASSRSRPPSWRTARPSWRRGTGSSRCSCARCALRGTERQHEYHKVLHAFVEQIERLLTVAVIVLLGGAMVRGVFPAFGWAEVGLVLVFLLVVRPLTGWVALLGGRTGPRERAVVAFFGVRGIGSLFYIAYAAQEGEFVDADRLWGIVALVVVGSVLIHGVSATPAMRALDRTARAPRPGGRRRACRDPRLG